MHRSSVYRLKIDFERSHDAYLTDQRSGREFLDFFGMYSTLTMGYSHPIFRETSFLQDVQKVAHLRVTNCEMASSEAERFLEAFSKHPAMEAFSHFHFCCTGALGIEAALKIAIDQKGSATPKVVSLKESFHGINSYGGFVTDRFHPVSLRLDGFPQMDWYRIHNPKILYQGNAVDYAGTERNLEQFKEELEACLQKAGRENVAALLVEPIQATAGDHYFPDAFFAFIRKWCDQNRALLIFDEVQTGFGTTGKMWYHEHKKILPDIVVFGKKAQVCGVMLREHLNKTLERPIRLEVTWDGDLIDMIRSTYVLKAFEKYNLLENVQARGRQLLEGLGKIPGLFCVRGEGLLAAFDVESKARQQILFQRAFEKGFLLNATREKAIRLRPPLTVTESEVERALDIIRQSVI